MIPASGSRAATSATRSVPVGVIGTGQCDLAAEATDGVGDPRVVGGDDDPVEPFRLPGRLDDVLDQGPPGIGKEGFAG